ncbi:MAG: sugar isomerase [Kiritimatiellales bacterium]
MNIFTDHPIPSIKAGFLFLGRKRPGFVPEWGALIEDKAREQLKTADFEVFYPSEKIVDIPTLRTAVLECKNNGCQVLVVIQPTMSDGRLAPVLGQESPAPVVFWATPEKQDGSMISACSLVGAHAFSAALAQLGHSFELVYGMPGEPKTVEDLKSAVYASYAASKVNGARVGLVGYHAPGFIDMHADPVALRENLAVELFHFGIKEFQDGLNAVPDDRAKDDLNEFLASGIAVSEELTREDLLLSSKYYLAMKDLMDSMSLDTLAVRDWPELSSTHWPFLAMARLASEGLAVTCEGDVDGALCCLLAYAAGCGAAYLSDWLEHDEHHVTLWHGGAAPFQMCQGLDSNLPPVINRHFNNRNPAVVDATLKPNMPITLFRLWRMNGKYLFTAIEGETEAPSRHLLGTNGAGRFDDVNIPDYLTRMIRKGFPHHPVIAEGHVKKHFQSIMSNLGVECLD